MWQAWQGEVRPPLEVLAHLLEGLDEVREARPSATLLIAAAHTRDEQGARKVGGGQEGGEGGGAGGEGGGQEAETEAARVAAAAAAKKKFEDWSRLTEELQSVPALESVDLPGDKEFTEGCLKVGSGLVLGLGSLGLGS